MFFSFSKVTAFFQCGVCKDVQFSSVNRSLLESGSLSGVGHNMPRGDAGSGVLELMKRALPVEHAGIPAVNDLPAHSWSLAGVTLASSNSITCKLSHQ